MGQAVVTYMVILATARVLEFFFLVSIRYNVARNFGLSTPRSVEVAYIMDLEFCPLIYVKIDRF